MKNTIRNILFMALLWIQYIEQIVMATNIGLSKLYYNMGKYKKEAILFR